MVCWFSRGDACPQVPRDMWDLPGPRIEFMSPPLQGRFLTTGPPGKPWNFHSFSVHLIKLIKIYTCFVGLMN